MLVGDRMTDHPLTISQNESVSSAHRYMQTEKIRHLPVVDRAGKMVGLVTESDLLKAEPSGMTLLSVWEIHSMLDKIKVKDVMVRDVITTIEDTPIEEAARLLFDHKVGCLPVMREGKLVGIITEHDMFEVFMELFSARQQGLRITMEVPNREGELAKVAQAIAGLGGDIAACGTFLGRDTTRWGIVLKVRNVDRQELTQALSQIPEQEIIDIREA